MPLCFLGPFFTCACTVFPEHEKCPNTRGIETEKEGNMKRRKIQIPRIDRQHRFETGCKPSQGAYRSWALSKPVPLPLIHRTQLSPSVPKDSDKLAMHRRDCLSIRTGINHVADDIWDVYSEKTEIDVPRS